MAKLRLLLSFLILLGLLRSAYGAENPEWKVRRAQALSRLQFIFYAEDEIFKKGDRETIKILSEFLNAMRTDLQKQNSVFLPSELEKLEHLVTRMSLVAGFKKSSQPQGITNFCRNLLSQSATSKRID